MVEMDLHISERFKACLPPLTAEQKKGLEEDIIADGRVTDPILYWNDGKRNVVIDGMHRWEIIRRKGITQFRTEPMPTAGNNYREVQDWIMRRAIHQRNMTREMIGEWYNKLKTARGGDRRTKVSNDTLKNTAEHISELTGKSVPTVRRDGKRVENIEKLDVSLRKAVNANAVKVSDEQLAKLVKATATKQEKVRSLVLKDNMTTKEAMQKVGLIHKANKPSDPAPSTDAAQESTSDGLTNAAKDGLGKLKASPEQRQAFAEYTENAQDELIESVLDERQSLDSAITTGEIPDPTTEAVMATMNKALESFCRQLMKWFENNCPQDEWIADMRRFDNAQEKVRQACATLRTAKCSHLCPMCEGAGCDQCLETGRVPKSVYQQMT